jgi:hypothetical protein
MNELVVNALSSAVVSALVSSVAGGWFALRAQQASYKNSYYSSVLSRRMDAYECIERIVANLKTAVLDDSGQPYHIGFSGESLQPLEQLIFETSSKATWFSDKMVEVTRDLSLIIRKYNGREDIPAEFGKRYYQALAELRTEIERTYARDMLSLHDVPAFLKGKRPTDFYEPV